MPCVRAVGKLDVFRACSIFKIFAVRPKREPVAQMRFFGLSVCRFEIDGKPD